MSDGTEIFIVFVIAMFFGLVGWNVGHDIGRRTEQNKTIESQEYVDSLRVLNNAQEKVKELKKGFANE